VVAHILLSFQKYCSFFSFFVFLQFLTREFFANNYHTSNLTEQATFWGYLLQNTLD